MSFFKRQNDRRRIRQLAESWRQFRSEIERQYTTPAGPSASDERRFLATQSRVAQKLPVLTQVQGRRSLEQEAYAASRDMTELMHRVSTLASACSLGAEATSEIMREWHVLFIFLQRLEGTMTGSTEDGVVLVDAARSRGGKVRAPSPEAPSFGDRVVRFTTRALIVVLIALGGAWLMGVEGADVTRWIDGFGGTTPPVVGGAEEAQAPTGETEVPAPSAPASSSRFPMPRLVQPVVTRYGSAGMAVLGGVMLAGTLLVFRWRTR